VSEKENPMQRIIKRCWADEDFKRRLTAEPSTVLAEEGMPVPQGVTVRVLEDAAHLVHWVIPTRPDSLDDRQLQQVAAGYKGTVKICAPGTY